MSHLMGKSVEETLKDLQKELLKRPKSFKKNKLKDEDDADEENKTRTGRETAVMADISNTKRAPGI